MLNQFNFNHDSEDFYEAMGLDERNVDIANYTVVYYMLTPLVTSALYDTEMEESSKSKIFENCLKRLSKNNTEQQLISLLLKFEHTYRKTMDRLKIYRDVLKDNMDEFKDGMKLGRVQAEDLGEAIKKITQMLDARPIAQMVEVLKETSCDYQKFMDFTVDEVDMRVVKGEMTQEEVDKLEDEDDSESTEEEIKQMIKNRKKKSYDDIDDIIRKALGGSDDEE
jgi:predicted ribosome quality control (RQC) complex YloA/Tae2 family protein